jgi:DNA polymerase III subunit delta
MKVTLTGANGFQLKQAADQVIAEFIVQHGDMAIERYDCEDADAARLRESINSLPFLTARKLVVLRSPGSQKQFAEAADDILSDTPETTDVLIVEPRLDKRTAYYKTLKKRTDFQDFPELDANGLAQWAVEYAKMHGAQLSLVDAKALIDRAGSNQQTIQNEIDKLRLYNPHITGNSITELVEHLPQSTVFELLDAAFAGNTQKAMALYAEQRALRVEPQAILAMIAWQLNSLVVIKAAGKKTPADIAKEAKINPYVVRKSQTVLRTISLSQLRLLVHSLLQLDVRLKRQSIDADEAVQQYILQLACR